MQRRKNKANDVGVDKSITRKFDKCFCFDTSQPIACSSQPLNIYMFILRLKYFLTCRGISR